MAALDAPMPPLPCAPAGPVRPFVSPDLCPWDAAELPEWQEALRRACQQWQQDAGDALAQVGERGGWRADALRTRAQPGAASARCLLPMRPFLTPLAAPCPAALRRVGQRQRRWATWLRRLSSTFGATRRQRCWPWQRACAMAQTTWLAWAPRSRASRGWRRWRR